MRYKILCTDGFSESGLSLLRQTDVLDVSYFPSLAHEELLKKIPEFDGLVVRSASSVSADVIERGRRLKVVARAGVGTDNIDVETATRRGILVVNAPSGNTTSTAELAFAMILSLSRNIPQASRAMAEGRWEKSKFKGTEVAFKTLGVIGLGRVGREVAARARAFKMKVVGHDPYLSREQFDALGVLALPLEEIYKTADYITIHTPLSKETENMITKKELKMMKPTVRLINCARGGIINEEDLAEALKNGGIAGAALDVFTKEPFDRPLFRNLDNCITTPHLGASTAEAQEAVAIETANVVIKFFLEGFVPSAVNVPYTGESALKDFGSYFILAERLGSLVAQLNSGGIKKITFSSAERLPPILTQAAVKGVLSRIVGEGITFVNAALVAKERGIGVVEETGGSAREFSGEMGVRLATDRAELSVCGRVAGDSALKVVRYNNYNIEIDPVGTILFIHNLDRPGVIGRVCTILGAENVNISEMQNVRRVKGEEALTIIGVDDALSSGAIDKIKKEAGIKDVRQVHL